MTAIIADIIASVEPQQTVISRSGSISTPCVRANFSAMASRSGLAPQVMAYWLMSAAMASWAARLISAGAGKSGKPWARLTAPWRIARRVISRITDSVKRSALAESICLRAAAFSGAAGFIDLSLRLGIEKPIDLGVAHHDLHVLPRLGERDRLDKLSRLVETPLRTPGYHAVLAGVIGRQRGFGTGLDTHQVGEQERPELQIVLWIKQPGARIAQFQPPRQLLPGLRQHLHQAYGTGARDGVRLEHRFLAGEAGHGDGVHVIAR